MKKLTTRLFVALTFLAMTFGANAQDGTQNDGFTVQVITGGKTYTYQEGACGFGVSLFGPDVTEEVEGDAAWADDSLGCAPLTNSLTGKFGILRRGTCNFSLKAYSAQAAGARAALIINHFATAADNGCTIVNMSGGDSAAAVTIPSIFMCRDMGSVIQQALDAGQPCRIKFVFPRAYDATAAYHYATPVSQVDTLDHITMHYVNRSAAAQTDVVLKAEIQTPSGATTTLTVPIAEVAQNQDTLVYFPSYLPPSELGTFRVTFSNNKFTEERDTLRREFVHTQYTYSQANFVNDPGGVGPTNADFINDSYRYQVGGLCLTGDTPGAKATWVSFGISNIDSVYVDGGSSSGANDILVFVYDGDPNDDGTIDFESTWGDMDAAGQQIAFGTYTMTGDETDGQIVAASLLDNNGNAGVELEPNHPYYVSLLYDGLLAGTGRCVRFMNSLQEFYLGFPSTPIYVQGTMFGGGWAGATTMHRLQLEGYDPLSAKTVALDAKKVAIMPNPANDVVNMKLELDGINKSVAVRMLDWTGRVVSLETRKNIQNETFTFDTANLPSGMYMMWISTEEGTAVKKVAVCH